MPYLLYFLAILFQISYMYAQECDPALNKILYRGKCEKLLEQGPCRIGEWLVYDKIYKAATCKKNICPPITVPVYKYFCGNLEIINLQNNSCAPDKVIYKDFVKYNDIEQAFWNGKCINATENPCKKNMELTLLPTGEPICACTDYWTHTYVQMFGKEEGCYEPYFPGPCYQNQILIPIFENGELVRTECRRNNCPQGEIEVIKNNRTGEIMLHTPGKCVKYDANNEICNGIHEKLTIRDFLLICGSTIAGGPPQNKINRVAIGCIYGEKKDGACKNASLHLVLGSG